MQYCVVLSESKEGKTGARPVAAVVLSEKKSWRMRWSKDGGQNVAKATRQQERERERERVVFVCLFVCFCACV